jgi:hypothetical protein
MDPRVVEAVQWAQLGRAMQALYLFAGLALNGAMAFLLAHAVIGRSGSVFGGAERRGGMAGPLAVLRWLLYPVSVASLVLAGLALTLALSIAVDVLEAVFPRFLI